MLFTDYVEQLKWTHALGTWGNRPIAKFMYVVRDFMCIMILYMKYWLHDETRSTFRIVTLIGDSRIYIY